MAEPIATWAIPGFLNLDKPAGWTSFEVVRVVRRALGVRRVGHAGTLDPIATGVLPVAVLSATRLTDLIHDYVKVYLGTIRLGVATATGDADGDVVFQAPVTVAPEAVRAALARFVGVIEQVPPRFSAVKVAGVPAYRRARAGEDVKLAPREVRIDAIDVVELRLPDVTVRVTCGKGTYLRALARDLGDTLGCGAHLLSLVRQAVGPFRLADAIPADRLEAMDHHAIRERFVSVADALPAYRRIVLNANAEAALRDGSPFTLPTGRLGELAVAVAPDGRSLGLARCVAGGLWRPTLVFPETRKAFPV